jgi:adenine/guanine/hypoxanthine permease
VDTEGPSAAFQTAYKVALVANFITGMILTTLACFGPLILQYVPPAALLVPIAGIGISFLGLEQLTNSIAAPIVGFYAIMWMFIGWYAGVRVGYGNWRLPEALQVILVGVILGWSTGLNKTSTVSDAAKLVKWWGPNLSLQELFSDFSMIKDYLGIVIPIAISAAATTLMCLVSAKGAGDPYPVRETMIVDGIGTMISSCFGSPFGTVVYIGHPAHKRSGALVGYSLTNGIVYIVLSWFGILALIQSLVNQATIGPIVLFVGLMINEESLDFMPPRHYAAFIVGLFPSIYDWTVNVSARSPQRDLVTLGDGSYPGSTGWYGVLAWKRGALLVSFIWVAMIVMVIDRRWKSATVWALIGACFALFGIIHVPAAGFKTFTEPTWEQCTIYPTECWDYAEQWMFMLAYVMLAATYALIETSRSTGFDKTLKAPIEDDTLHAFADWFADAGVIKPVESETDEVGLYKDVSKKTAKTSHGEDPEAEDDFEETVA